jgi:hypothetical protein
MPGTRPKPAKVPLLPRLFILAIDLFILQVLGLPDVNTGNAQPLCVLQAVLGINEP